jgi:hypothetical protein
MKCVAYVLIVALLLAPFGCSYKPAYLQKSKKTEISERWRVVKINPERLSPDEAQVYRTTGAPQFIRFNRKHGVDRERVYTWIYTNPVRLFFFLDGKKVDYVVLDDNPSPLNDYQKKVLLWSGATVGTIASLGLLYYYFVAKH